MVSQQRKQTQPVRGLPSNNSNLASTNSYAIAGEAENVTYTITCKARKTHKRLLLLLLPIFMIQSQDDNGLF
jgi:hypothetical protein